MSTTPTPTPLQSHFLQVAQDQFVQDVDAVDGARIDGARITQLVAIEKKLLKMVEDLIWAEHASDRAMGERLLIILLGGASTGGAA